MPPERDRPGNLPPHLQRLFRGRKPAREGTDPESGPERRPEVPAAVSHLLHGSGDAGDHRRPGGFDRTLRRTAPEHHPEVLQRVQGGDPGRLRGEPLPRGREAGGPEEPGDEIHAARVRAAGHLPGPDLHLLPAGRPVPAHPRGGRHPRPHRQPPDAHRAGKPVRHARRKRGRTLRPREGNPRLRGQGHAEQGDRRRGEHLHPHGHHAPQEHHPQDGHQDGRRSIRTSPSTGSISWTSSLSCRTRASSRN